MKIEMFNQILSILDRLGIAQPDIDWSEHCKPPVSAEEFASEAIFVICNSGMKHTVARRIYAKIMPELQSDGSASSVFGHRGKCGAIDQIWQDRERLFAEYIAAVDKVTYCETLPFIGPITKFHLAKTFGVQVAKPDVHLQRLAEHEHTTPQSLCETLATQTGYRVSTIDLLLWRVCAMGVMDSKTGLLNI